VKTIYKEFDFRPAFVFDDVKGVGLKNVQIPTGEELPIILFNNTKDKTIENVNLPVETGKGIKEQ
jgi:hypothetical protein